MKKNLKIGVGIALCIAVIGIYNMVKTINNHSMYVDVYRGNHGTSFKLAEFEDLRGSDNFEIKIKEKGTFHFKYSVKVKKGNLSLYVLKGRKVLYSDKKIKANKNGEFDIELKEAKDLTLRIVGISATGSYNVEWAHN